MSLRCLKHNYTDIFTFPEKRHRRMMKQQHKFARLKWPQKKKELHYRFDSRKVYKDIFTFPEKGTG